MGKRLPANGTFLGQDLFLKESTEPTNIIWENRHWTPRDYLKRGMIVFGIITVLVLVSFGLIFLCKSYSLEIKNKYPTVDCNVIKKNYNTRLEEYAFREWDEHYNWEEKTFNIPTPFSGALQCYCDQYAEYGLKGTKMMYHTVKNDAG